MYKKDVRTFRLSNVQDGMLIIDSPSILPLTLFSQTQFRLVKPQIISERSRCFMPQLLFQDRRDMKRASVGLLTRYLVDL